MTCTDQDLERVAKNDPAEDDYDPDYPDTPDVGMREYQDNTFDKDNQAYRLNFEHPSPLGTWALAAYYYKENLQYGYYVNEAHTAYTLYDWDRDQWGGRIEDEIKFSENDITTVGLEVAEVYDGPWQYSPNMNRSERERFKAKSALGGYIQHKWMPLEGLTLTPGVRYENVSLQFRNWDDSSQDYSVGSVQKKYIETENDAWVPKLFLTYRLDGLSSGLRDSAISLGVSKIWSATPFCVGSRPCRSAHLRPLGMDPGGI